MAPRLRPRSPLLATVLALAASASLARLALTFLPGLAPQASSTTTLASRRGALLGLGSAVLLADASGPAVAAEAPAKLEVTGMPLSRNKANGFWSITSQQVNSRAVYKKEGAELYLMFNDCGGFQMSEKISGTCDGFAQEADRKWTVDGTEVLLIKIRPVSPEKKAGGQEKAAAESAEVGGSLSLPSLNINKLFFSGNETDQELLFRGSDVGAYIKAKGGSEGFLQGLFVLSPDEAKVATSLEERLKARQSGLVIQGQGFQQR